MRVQSGGFSHNTYLTDPYPADLGNPAGNPGRIDIYLILEGLAKRYLYDYRTL